MFLQDIEESYHFFDIFLLLLLISGAFDSGSPNIIMLLLAH